MNSILVTAPPHTGLYSEVLGPRWTELHSAVRAMHSTGETLTRTGTFQVRRGTSLIAKFLQAVLGLPKQSAASAVTLRIEPQVTGEHWFRRIGDVAFDTIQSPATENRLRERVGVVDLYFRLQVTDGGLKYHQVGAKLALGLLAIPLPRWFAPRVIASEMPCDEDVVDVSVHVTIPLVGLLIAYEGTLSTEPPK